MVMLSVQYSRSYGENLLGTIVTHTPLVDNNTAFGLSVSHTALHYSAEQQNYRVTNGSTCK